MATETLGDLYSFNAKSGVVIPDTLGVRSRVEAMMREVFGVSDLDVTPETPMGRMIEALTFIIVDFAGVTAQNANNFNPSNAVGMYLDNLGKMFDIPRNPSGMSDAEFREKIMTSQSRGMGYVQSIRQALMNVSGVSSVCVFENGHKYQITQPPDPTYGIGIDPHSVYICVGGGNYPTQEEITDFNNRVAKAILGVKSAGCGYTDHQTVSEYGTRVSVSVTDEATGSQNTVIFYKPNERPYVLMNVSVDSRNYTGSDIIAETRQIIVDYMAGRSQNAVTTKMQIATAIGSAGSGISCLDVGITIGGTAVDNIALRPSQYINLLATNITVNITQ